MIFVSRLAMLALPLLLLAGASAGAEETKSPQASQDAEISTGLICDTQQQVERFISLYDGDPQGTVRRVNGAEGDPTACAFVTMAYIRGRTLTTAYHKDAAFQIVPILVLGVVTESGIEAVTPAVCFSAIEIEQIGI